MKLRKKLVIFICVVALFGLGLTYLLLHLILLGRFEKLDEAALRYKLENAVSSYQNELQSMKTQLLKYSVWDETYRFAESTDPADSISDAYLSSNYSRTTYEINHFDMMALLNPSGTPCTVALTTQTPAA